MCLCICIYLQVFILPVFLYFILNECYKKFQNSISAPFFCYLHVFVLCSLSITVFLGTFLLTLSWQCLLKDTVNTQHTSECPGIPLSLLTSCAPMLIFFFLQLCYDFLFFNDIVFAHFVIHKTVVREKVFICSSLLSVYLKEAQIITCQRKEDTKINGN